MAAHLVGDLLRCPEIGCIMIIENVPEQTAYPDDPRVALFRNPSPRGYGANHNDALARCTAPFLCVLNPDVRLPSNPFPALLGAMKEECVAGVAPVIEDPDGRREDSARKFPTFASLLSKAVGLNKGTYESATERANPDWLAGMFSLWNSSVLRDVDGFDEGFYLYYEDVDLCWRLRRRGYLLRQVQEVKAIHDARRASRRDWRHARWHLASMARFLARRARP